MEPICWTCLWRHEYGFDKQSNSQIKLQKQISLPMPLIFTFQAQASIVMSNYTILGDLDTHLEVQFFLKECKSWEFEGKERNISWYFCLW